MQDYHLAAKLCEKNFAAKTDVKVYEQANLRCAPVEDPFAQEMNIRSNSC